jgi:hypothetical protein
LEHIQINFPPGFIHFETLLEQNPEVDMGAAFCMLGMSLKDKPDRHRQALLV